MTIKVKVEATNRGLTLVIDYDGISYDSLDAYLLARYGTMDTKSNALEGAFSALYNACIKAAEQLDDIVKNDIIADLLYNSVGIDNIPDDLAVRHYSDNLDLTYNYLYNAQKEANHD